MGGGRDRVDLRADVDVLQREISLASGGNSSRRLSTNLASDFCILHKVHTWKDCTKVSYFRFYPSSSSSWSSSFVTCQPYIDLFRPRLIVCSKMFQVVFVHLVYNSALLLTSCCCSFLLHFVAYFICICLVSCKLVLLSNLPKFLHSSCDQEGCTWLFFRKISSRLMSIVFILFYKGLNFAST